MHLLNPQKNILIHLTLPRVGPLGVYKHTYIHIFIAQFRTNRPLIFTLPFKKWMQVCDIKKLLIMMTIRQKLLINYE